MKPCQKHLMRVLLDVTGKIAGCVETKEQIRGSQNKRRLQSPVINLSGFTHITFDCTMHWEHRKRVSISTLGFVEQQILHLGFWLLKAENLLVQGQCGFAPHDLI